MPNKPVRRTLVPIQAPPACKCGNSGEWTLQWSHIDADYWLRQELGTVVQVKIVCSKCGLPGGVMKCKVSMAPLNQP